MTQRNVSIRVMASILACAFTLSCGMAAGAAEAKTGPKSKAAPAPSDIALGALPAAVHNFRLDDQQGKSWELFRYNASKAIVLVTTGNGCPIVRKSIPRLKELRDQYAGKGVIFFMIDGNTSDTRDSVAKEAKEFQIDIPILIDDDQLVTKGLGAKRTAECYVVQPEGWKIVYHGAIDDSQDYGVTRPGQTHDWLKDALDAVLADKPVTTAETEAKGCLLDIRPAPKKVSYAHHVAPILEAKCVACHVDGGIGPFAMDSYESVVGKQRMIREVLMTRRMPPWHADPHFGEFKNGRALTAKEIEQLVAWIDDGAPRGSGSDPLVKAARIQLASNKSPWPLGEPDITLPMPEAFDVPASGVVGYQYFRVPYTGDKDVWVRAADVLAGSKEVLHHVLVFIEYPDRLSDQQPEFHGGLGGYFAGYVPGQTAREFPKGTAKLVPAGSTFIFQVHYNPSGRAVSDLSKLGLYLFKGKHPKEMLTRATADTEFNIPPGDPEFTTSASYQFSKDAILYEMSPHMHYRGKEFKYTAHYPDGKSEVLLSVPNYNFNWQTMYLLDEPKVIPAGTRIECEGAFDNSPCNPSNPDPNKWVQFGEQTFEEMFIGYMGYVEQPAKVSKHPAQVAKQGLGKAITAEALVGTKWKIGPYRLTFQGSGKLLVGPDMEGTWNLAGDRVLANVGGRDYTLIVKGDQLTDDKGQPLEYLS